MPSAKAIEASSSGRLAFLDVIRGLAALLVAVQHGLEVAIPGYMEWSVRHLNAGQVGVVAFFLVSGFIIPASLERQGELRRFWIGRFFRILPLYWASLLAVVALDRLDLFLVPPGVGGGDSRGLLINALMVQDLARVPHALGVYWTLTLEMGFYAVCSLLFAAGLLRRSALWASVALGAVLAASLAASATAPALIPAWRPWLLATAFVGTLLYRVSIGEAPRRRLLAVLAFAAAVFSICFALRFEVHPTVGAAKPWSALGIGISYLAGYALVLGIYALRARRFPGALTYLGRISYSIYLVQFPVMMALPRFSGPAVWMICFIASTLAISAATYALIEHPSIEAGKTWIRRWPRDRRRSKAEIGRQPDLVERKTLERVGPGPRVHM